MMNWHEMVFNVDRVMARRVVFGLIFFGFTFFFGSFLYKKLFPKNIFVSRFSLVWYPREPEALRTTIATLFERAAEKYPQASDQKYPWMICVPHAGYAFSGEVAAAGYQYLRGNAAKNIKRVIVLSPSHYIDFYGVCVPDFSHYQTPFGLAQIDTAMVKKIEQEELMITHDSAFYREHAIDVQIPWIQTCLPQAKIVPLIIGRIAGDDMVPHIAEILSRYVDASTVVVVSSDFVHYGKRFEYCPFGVTKEATLQVDAVEQMIINACCMMRRSSLEHVFAETKAAICGKNVLKVACELAARTIAESSGEVKTLQECAQGICVALDDSFAIRERLGERVPEYERVGYASLVFSVK